MIEIHCADCGRITQVPVALDVNAAQLLLDHHASMQHLDARTVTERRLARQR